MWLYLNQVIFSLLRLRCFIAAGQFAFPFYLSFHQALKQCSSSLTLNQSAQFSMVGIVLGGILGSSWRMTFMTRAAETITTRLGCRNTHHAQKVVDIATGLESKTTPALIVFTNAFYNCPPSDNNSEVTKSHPKGDDDIEFSID